MPASKAIPFVDSTAINLDWTGTIKNEGAEKFYSQGAARVANSRPLSPQTGWQSSRETAQERQRSVIAAFLPSASIMPSKFDFFEKSLKPDERARHRSRPAFFFTSEGEQRGRGCRTFQLEHSWQFFLFYPRSDVDVIFIPF